MPRSFLWRFSFTIIAIQILLTLVAGIFLVQWVRSLHEEQTIRTLSQIVPIVTSDIESRKNVNKLDSTIKGQFGTTDFRVTVINPEGVVIADSDAQTSEMENHLMRKEVQLALHTDGEGWAEHRSRTLGINMMYYAKRFQIQENQWGVVRVSMPSSSIERGLASILEATIIVGIVLITTTILLTILLSKMMASNIRVLVDGANKFATGNLKHQIPEVGTSELSILRQKLNSMAIKLQQGLDELEQSKSEQHAILQSMPTGVIALDSEKLILSFNASATNILSVPSSLTPRGRQLEEFVRDIDLSVYLENATLSDKEYRGEIIVLDHAGRGRELLVAIVPLGNQNQKLSGYLVLLDDVTMMRRLEGIRSDFSANVSHELRTPITAIKGYVETLEEFYAEEKQAQKCIEVIVRNTNRLEKIVEDLLSLAALENINSKETLAFTQTNVLDLLRDVQRMHAKEMVESNIQCQINCPQETTVLGNQQLLEQAIGNVLQNAIRYGGQNRPISIEVTTENGLVHISVCDEGDGIPKEFHERVFERFFRVDKGRSRESGGTGLGLAIVKHVTQVHGGTVSVHRGSEGGSTFVIKLPLWSC